VHAALAALELAMASSISPPATVHPVNAIEKAQFEMAFLRTREEWGFAQSYTFEGLLEQWAAFALEVQTCFQGIQEEYTVRLALRDELDALISALSERQATAVRGYLAPYDERYLFATRPVSEPLLPGEAGIKQSPRWYRIPIRLSPLHDDDSWNEYLQPNGKKK
jgi:hypothetical protein